MKISARLLDCFVLGHSVLKTKQLRLFIQSLWFRNLKGIGNKSPTAISPLKLTSEAQHARTALARRLGRAFSIYRQLLCTATQLLQLSLLSSIANYYYQCWRMEDSLTASELAQLEYHTIGTVVCKINHCKEMLVLCSFFSSQQGVDTIMVSSILARYERSSLS